MTRFCRIVFLVLVGSVAIAGCKSPTATESSVSSTGNGAKISDQQTAAIDANPHLTPKMKANEKENLANGNGFRDYMNKSMAGKKN